METPLLIQLGSVGRGGAGRMPIATSPDNRRKLWIVNSIYYFALLS
jgi:hypothetical protein